MTFEIVDWTGYKYTRELGDFESFINCYEANQSETLKRERLRKWVKDCEVGSTFKASHSTIKRIS